MFNFALSRAKYKTLNVRSPKQFKAEKPNDTSHPKVRIRASSEYKIVANDDLNRLIPDIDFVHSSVFGPVTTPHKKANSSHPQIISEDKKAK